MSSPYPPQSNSSAPSAATINYSRKACALVAASLRQSLQNRQEEASSSSGKPAYTTSENGQKEFLLSLAQHFMKNHPGFVQRDDAEVLEPDDASTGGMNVPHKARSSVDVLLPSCQFCGAGLQPGYDGTTVRLKRQRRKKRQRKPMVPMKRSPNALDGGVGATWADADIRAFQGSRNYLVVTCSYCQSKCRVPGLPRLKHNSAELHRKTSERGTMSVQNKYDSGEAGTTKRTTLSVASTIPPKRPKTFEEAVESGLDFVPLSAKSGEPAPENVRDADSKRKENSFSASLLPLQNLPKKKKMKKQPKKSSSQLLDFLSSLND